MSWLASGFISLFDWMFPRTAEEIIDNFYLDHPEMEKDDIKALENDFRTIMNDSKLGD